MDPRIIRRFARVTVASLSIETVSAVGMLLEDDDCRNDGPIIVCRQPALDPSNFHLPHGEFETEFYASTPWIASGQVAASPSTSTNPYRMTLAGENNLGRWRR